MMVSDLAGRSVWTIPPRWLAPRSRTAPIESRAAGSKVSAWAPADVGSLRTNDRGVSGTLEIVKSGDGLTVINELPLGTTWPAR